MPTDAICDGHEETEHGINCAQRDHAGWDRKVGNILWCVQGITMENHEFGMNLDVSLFFTMFHQPKCLTWLNNQTYSKFNNMASDTQKCKVSTLDQILILNKTNTHMTSTNHLTCSWRILATGQVSGVFLWLDLSGWRDHAASANKTVVARKSLTNIGYRATLWSCSHLSSILLFYGKTAAETANEISCLKTCQYINPFKTVSATCHIQSTART